MGGLNSENEFEISLETSSWIHARENAELHKKIIMKLEKKLSDATMLEYWGEGQSKTDDNDQEVYVQTLLTEMLTWIKDGDRFRMGGDRDMPHLNLRL